MVYCKRCGMPMDLPALRGTDVHGHPTDDYCCYCMIQGEWQPRPTPFDKKYHSK